MRIRMVTSMTGTRGGVEWPPPGEELDVEDDEGAQLCGAGIAVPVREKRTEKAVAPKAEERAAKAGESKAKK